ncbi:MAG TPA: MFS transporter [Chloroflexota bacterium]
MAALGVLATVQLLGLLVFSLTGGAIADVLDRRRLILWAQLGLAAVSVALALLALTHSATEWSLYSLSFATGVLTAVDRPSRQSVVPLLVRREAVTSAIALNQAGQKLARIVGPAIGGLVVGALDVSAVYVLDIATYGVAVGCVLRMAIPRDGGVMKPGWAAIAEALRYVRQTPYLLSSLVMDFNAMLFGLPVALFPVLAVDVFHVGPQGLGVLMAAQPLGAVLGGLSSGWLLTMRYQGRVVIGSVIAWGICMAMLGLSPWFPLTVGFMMLGAIANVISAAVRGTIVQLTTPHRLRGRVSAFSSMITNGGPRLGDLEAASVAAWTTPQISIVSGGLLCLAGVALVCRRFPQLAAYQAPGSEQPAESGSALEAAVAIAR